MISSVMDHVIRLLRSLGVKGGVEVISSERFDAFMNYFKENEHQIDLTVSIVPSATEDGFERAIHQFQAYDRSDAGKPRPVFIKAFADGSIGAHTASFTFPYVDGYSVEPLMDSSAIGRFVKECHFNGSIPMIHSIGDMALDEVIKGCRFSEKPIRVEHLESVREAQIIELKRSSIIACMQPNFSDRWGRKGGLYEKMIGSAYHSLNPFREIASAGIPLVFGTDMMPAGPLDGISGAIDHPNESHRMRFEDTIDCFTYNARKFSFLHDAVIGFKVGMECNIIIVEKETLSKKMIILDGVVVKNNLILFPNSSIPNNMKGHMEKFK